MLWEARGSFSLLGANGIRAVVSLGTTVPRCVYVWERGIGFLLNSEFDWIICRLRGCQEPVNLFPRQHFVCRGLNLLHQKCFIQIQTILLFKWFCYCESWWFVTKVIGCTLHFHRFGLLPWSFRDHSDMLIWCSVNLYYQCWKLCWIIWGKAQGL